MPSNQPRLMLDTTNTIYELSDDIMPKLEDKTRVQKLDRETQQPLWTVPIYGRGRAAGAKWSGVFNVTVVSDTKPNAEEGDQVSFENLEALPWVSEQNGRTRSGVAFKASGLEVMSAPVALQAA
jgi:hypothetical protein